MKILFEVKIVTTYNIYLTLDKSEILFIRDSAKKKNQNSNNQQQQTAYKNSKNIGA